VGRKLFVPIQLVRELNAIASLLDSNGITDLRPALARGEIVGVVSAR